MASSHDSGTVSIHGAGEARTAIHPVRKMLLALVLVGSFGLLAELILLEHTDESAQWIPLVLLTATIASSTALAIWPRRATVRLFQGLMWLLLIASAAGLYFHVVSNLEFELEMDETVGGLALVWATLRGGTPALAPGALAQIGLLGLILTFRHPAAAER